MKCYYVNKCLLDADVCKYGFYCVDEAQLVLAYEEQGEGLFFNNQMLLFAILDDVVDIWCCYFSL